MANFFSSKYSGMKSIVFVAGALALSGCVADNSTSALTNTEIQEKLSSHEQRHVASKCNSANRLSSSNSASSALNDKLTLLEEASATMDAAKKQALSTKLQSYGGQLQPLDQNLNNQCVTYSACEYQAASTKQSCSAQKHKFQDAEKQMVTLTRQISQVSVN